MKEKDQLSLVGVYAEPVYVVIRHFIVTQPANEEFFAAIGPDLTIHFIMLATQDCLFLILRKVNRQ